MSQLTCRFYINPLPQRGDVVMVRGVRKSSDNDGIYVELLEFDGLEGFIPTREFRIRAWEGHMASHCMSLLGRLHCAEVADVDEDLVFLSLKRVFKEDAKVCRERYAKGKLVQSILRRVAHRLLFKSPSQFEQLHRKSVWIFCNKNPGCSTIGYDCFTKVAFGDESILDNLEIDKEILFEEIQKRLKKKSVDVSSRFELRCFRSEGIDSIKQALFAGLELSTDEIPLKINLVCSPEYIIKTNSIDEVLAVNTIEKALAVVESKILELGGQFKSLSKPEILYPIKEEDEESDEEIAEDSGIVADYKKTINRADFFKKSRKSTAAAASDSD